MEIEIFQYPALWHLERYTKLCKLACCINSIILGQRIKKTHITLKNKGLILSAIIFIVLVNTTYYWEGKLGFFTILIDLALAGACVGFIIVLFRQIYLALKEKFRDRQRFILIILLITALVSVLRKQYGFNNHEANDLLVAGREGAANCNTILSLKEDFTFDETTVCFGVSVVEGKYHLQNDTIYFDNVQLGRRGDKYYKFAVIKKSKFNNSKIIADIVRYENLKDTIGHDLWVTKNELNKLKYKKPNH